MSEKNSENMSMDSFKCESPEAAVEMIKNLAKANGLKFAFNDKANKSQDNAKKEAAVKSAPTKKETKEESIFKEEKPNKVAKKAPKTSPLAGLEKFNEKFMASANTDTTVLSNAHTKEEAFAQYGKLLEDDKAFKIRFSGVTEDLTFSGVDENGVFIIMSSKDTKHGFPYFESQYKTKYLSFEYEVKVKTVDVEKNCLYVVSAKSESTIAKGDARYVTRILTEAIENKTYPEVYGRVLSVGDEYANVNLYDLGVRARIFKSHWAKGKVGTLTTVCKKNEVYKFQATSIFVDRKNHSKIFVLDRRNFSSDSWASVPAEILQEGATLSVKCISIPKGRSYWWGETEYLPGIELMGDFQSQLSKIRLLEGISYKCKILNITKDANGNNDKVKVIPFAVADKDLTEYNKLMMAKDFKLSDLKKQDDLSSAV